MSLTRRLDWLLIVTAAILTIAGAILVWSATAHRVELTGGNATLFLQRQLASAAVGIVLFVVVVRAGHRAIRTWAPVICAVCVVVLVAVLVIGVTVNGTRGWIRFPGGISLQPSEFAKIALVIGLSYLLAERTEVNGRSVPTIGDAIWSLLLAGVLVGLVLAQPDVGTSVVLAATAVGILVLSGVRLRSLLALAVGCGVLVAVALRLGLVADYQIERIVAFADPESDPRGSGYNVVQAGLAIGSGGLTGQGLFQGTRTTGAYVPEQHTDFIFTVAGEELGFLGATAVLLLLGLVLWRAVRITARAQDTFGRLVGAGIVCWLAIQTFENVGMSLGLAPITGVPLPFVSYGGSSLVAVMAAIALLENIHLSTTER